MATMPDDDDRSMPGQLRDYLKKNPQLAKDYLDRPPHRGATAPNEVARRERHEAAVALIRGLYEKAYK